MCAIAGVLSPGPGEVLERSLDRMVEIQAHRGPDDRGRWTGSIGSLHVALGTARLAILDLGPAGHQPMVSPNGRQILVYNGEVYNYRELREELMQAGVSFQGGSDTEVVLHALLHWGEDAVNRFNGMWAFAWLDQDRGTLLLSRDRFGVKPLYYYVGERAFYFGSEIKSILSGAEERFGLCEKVIARYLGQSLLDAQEETFFAGILSLPAGHAMRFDLRSQNWSQTRPHRYWTAPSDVPFIESIEACASQIRETFFDAVRLRLRSDRPVGVLLSGGIDSSCIASAMQELLGRDADLHLISAVSDDARFSEETYIDRMTAHLGSKTHKVRIQPDEVLGLLERVTWFNDEPVGSVSSLMHYLLMERARDINVTVILSGQGADELLCGYDKYSGFYMQSLLRQRNYPGSIRLLYDLVRHGALLKQFRWSEAKRYLPQGIRRWQVPTLGPRLKDLDSRVCVGLGEGDIVARQIADLTHLSVPALVHYEDRMSMATSREIRLPFLDHRLVTLLLPLPPELKMRDGWSKWIFRKAMQGSLPDAILWRRDKQPFVNPQSEWLKQELRGSVLKMLGEGLRAAEAGLVDADGLRRTYEAYCAQPAARGPISFKDIFGPLALETWLRRFEGHLRLN